MVLHNAYDGMTEGRHQIGTVVDIGLGETDDSKKDGRVLVRFTPQQGTGQGEDQLVWCHIERTAAEGGFRKIGNPGHNLTPGTTVRCSMYGQQHFVITNVLANENPNQSMRDLDHSGKHRLVLQDPNLDKEYQESQGYLYAIKPGPAADANFASYNIKDELGNTLKRLSREIKKALRFDPKRGLKSVVGTHTPDTIASFRKMAADPLNAPKYIQQILGQKGELIPKALQMALNLQQKAKQGALQIAAELVGGQQLVSTALAGIAQIVSASAKQAKSKDAKDDEPMEMKNIMCILYEEETGLSCKDLEGKDSKLFLKWLNEQITVHNKDDDGETA